MLLQYLLLPGIIQVLQLKWLLSWTFCHSYDMFITLSRRGAGILALCSIEIALQYIIIETISIILFEMELLLIHKCALGFIHLLQETLNVSLFLLYDALSNPFLFLLCSLEHDFGIIFITNSILPLSDIFLRDIALLNHLIIWIKSNFSLSILSSSACLSIRNLLFIPWLFTLSLHFAFII